MLRRIATAALLMFVIIPPARALARQKNPKPGPLTGTWECVAHGTSRGDLSFTLMLEQTGETITGSVSSPIGSTEISNGTYKKKGVTIHIEAGAEDSYDLSGKFKKGLLSGEWSHGAEKGAWDGSKQGATAGRKGAKKAAPTS